MPAVVFVTAHDQYAVRAFEISAIDYLLKPVTAKRFETAFERAKSRLGSVPASEASQKILAMLDVVANPPRYPARLAVRDGEKTVLVAVEDVDRIEALQNYVRLHVGSARHLLHVPLSTIETALDPVRFVRIHRSHIVNLRRVRQFWPLAHGQYVVELTSGERLQSGRSYGERIRRILTNPF
jgi:two-component system LytT family response regulator